MHWPRPTIRHHQPIISLLDSKEKVFFRKNRLIFFFFTIAQWTIKFEMRYRKIRKEATFPRILLLLWIFLYFDLRSCVYLLLKNFDWTLYSSFYFLLCCFVCFFFSGDSWENVFRRLYWSGAVRRRLPIGSTVLAPWTAYLFSASFFSVCDVCFVVYSRSSYPEATE